MNAQVEALGLENTHFDNPHGLTSDTHKVTAADMAEILRWAMEQPGFMTLFTNNEMYIMDPTNKQEETRYFSLSDSVRIGSSKYYVPEVIGSKTGYTDASRYTYAAVGESDGRTFICVTLHSEEKADRYNDAKTLFDYAFAHFTKVEIPGSGETFDLEIYGGNAKLGEGEVTAAGLSLYLYDGIGADTVTCTYEMDEQYIIGGNYQAAAVYTLPATSEQEGFIYAVPMTISGVDTVVKANVGIGLAATESLLPQVSKAVGAGIIVAILAVLAVVFVVVWFLRKRPAKRKSRYQRVHRYHR